MTKQTQRRNQRGSALLICMGMLFVVSLVGLTLLSTSASGSKLANQGWQKAQADLAAQSGIYAMYAQLSYAQTSKAAPVETPISSTALTGSVGGTTTADGSYSARIVSKTLSFVDGQQAFTYVIEGDGVAPNTVTTSSLRATAVITLGWDGPSLPDAAIISAGDVRLTGGAYTVDPTSNNLAGVIANGSITDMSPSVTIDGVASYYQPSTVAGAAKSVVQLTSPIYFPSSSTISGWQSSWLADSQESTTMHPGGNTSGPISVGADTTLTGPMYINGDLTVTGSSTLTINVDTGASAPVIVFVNGDVKVSGGGSVVNNGVLLVSTGTQSYSGTANVYSATDPVNCGLISLSTDSNNAISIAGGASGQVGVIYALNGGVTMNGAANFVGSVIGGGSSATVTLTGGASVSYQGGNSQWGPGAGYLPGSLKNWVDVQ